MATSSGVGDHAAGVDAGEARLLVGAVVGQPVTMGVSVSHGQTAKTLMFLSAKPAATDWVMLITPGLGRAQQDGVGEGEDGAHERRGVDDDPAPLP